MEEDFHGWGNGCIILLSVPSTVILNSEYKECEQITYTVKEHYDWLKSSASLSTLKKHVIFFPKHGIGYKIQDLYSSHTQLYRNQQWNVR